MLCKCSESKAQRQTHDVHIPVHTHAVEGVNREIRGYDAWQWEQGSKVGENMGERHCPSSEVTQGSA